MYGPNLQANGNTYDWKVCLDNLHTISLEDDLEFSFFFCSNI